jgi:hypothetical protein
MKKKKKKSVKKQPNFSDIGVPIYRLTVTYDPGKLPLQLDPDLIDNELGSGCGFGERDISYGFLTKKELVRVQKKFWKKYGNKLNMEVSAELMEERYAKDL